MNILARNPEGYRLLHEGCIALANVERNGMRIDTDYLARAIKRTKNKVLLYEEELKEDNIFKEWRKTFGAKTNLGSRDQLARIIFEVLEHPCKSYTASGRPSADEAAFAHLDLKFLKDYARCEKYKKALGTYLEGIRSETSLTGFLHPSFNLHLVKTYRSSSDSPNFQNIPIRDKEIGELIRRAIIPRKGHVIVEIDYSGIEVRIAACYHQDPTMLKYIKDPSKDMHRDMAAQLYHLTQKEMETQKVARYCAKNMFVFPQFYGDYYVHCAKSLWEAIDTMKLTIDGVSLKERLRSKGIRSLGACDPKQKPVKGTYEYYVKEVEDDFWQRRFPVYSRWKKKWHEQYLNTGGFDTLSGFRCEGIYGRNDVINYPVQGSAFHCLLWSLIQMNRWLIINAMRSLVIGQIHDSIVLDVHLSELEDVLRQARKIMTQRLLQKWKWINVPLEIEAEACARGESWADKKSVLIPA